MSKIVKNIMIRAIKARMKQGETLDDILDSYPKLSEAEKEELRKAVA